MVQMDIKWVLELKYYYLLYLANVIPIQAILPHLQPVEKTWLDVYLDELVAKGIVGPILLGN